MVELSRRGFIGGLVGLVTAPAIVRAASLMPVKAVRPVMPLEVLQMGLEHPTILPPSLYRALMEEVRKGLIAVRPGDFIEQKPIPLGELGRYDGVRFLGIR